VLNFENSGTVEASNTDGTFIATILANTIGNLTNSGSIIAPLDPGGVAGNHDHAIEEAVGVGGDTVLTLLPGSVIQGQINLDGGAGNDTLVVGSGLNLASTFQGVGSVDEIVAPGALVTRTAAGGLWRPDRCGGHLVAGGRG
jgi:hypothetical protein